MLSSISSKFLNWEKFRTNAVFLVLLIMTMLGFQWAEAYLSQVAGTTTKPLDLEFFFTAERAYQLIATYNEAVRNFYVPFELTADIIYPTLYGTYLALLISFLLKINFQNIDNQSVKVLNLLPLGASIFDFLENIGITILVSNYQTRLDTLATLTGLMGGIKWIFAILSLLTLLILFVRWILKRLLSF
jgi:hypothetical protein